VIGRLAVPAVLVGDAGLASIYLRSEMALRLGITPAGYRRREGIYVNREALSKEDRGKLGA
jgi:hypothetical protein